MSLSLFSRPVSMPAYERARARPSPRLRTYVLLAIGEAAGVTEFARPLGTLLAATRTLARAAACAIHADIAPAALRAVAAGSAPPGFLARALALDGERLLSGLGAGGVGGNPFESAA